MVSRGEALEPSRWPSVPPEAVASRCASGRAAQDRFPSDVRSVLVQAGWFPGRDVGAAVDQWLTRVGPDLGNLECSAAARAVLVEFGGLELPQYGPGGVGFGGFRSWFYPRPGRMYVDREEGFVEETGIPVFPVASHEDEGSSLVVDPTGRMLQLHWVGDFLVGTGDEAIINLIRGVPFLELDDDGNVMGDVRSCEAGGPNELPA